MTINRENIWIHVSLAVVLITFTAVLGQIERWKSGTNSERYVVKNVSKHVDTIPLRYRRAEVIVRFKPGTSVEKMRAVAAAKNDVLKDEVESVSGLAVIDDLDDADPIAVATEYLAMSEDVAYAEPNIKISFNDPLEKQPVTDAFFRASLGGAPNDPMFIEQWALNNTGAKSGTERADLDAEAAWAKTTGSQDVVVAVMDSGVDYLHEDLDANMWQRPANIKAYFDDELGAFNDQNGFNGIDRDADPMDDNGHGTHCAGIIGAEGNNGIGIAGINWKVKLLPLKILDRGGSGSAEQAIAAINYAIERKNAGVNIRIISASWGSNVYSRALEDSIRAAGDAGILFVAAAGNDGTSNDRLPHYPSNYALPNVVSVAALDRNDKLASFSNFGVNTVHIAAPGKAIMSTWLNGQYREASGTSMATPYVSGVAALLISTQPKISMLELRKKLLNSVDKIDSLNGKVASGGRICAANILD